MAENSRHSSVEIHSAVAYESRDVNVRALVWVGAGVLIAAVIISVGMGRLYHFYRSDSRNESGDGRQGLQPRRPPAPRLQLSPAADLKEYRTVADQRLHEYGWIDRPAGIVRIPIAQAMRLIVERGATGLSPPSSPVPANDGRTREVTARPAHSGKRK